MRTDLHPFAVASALVLAACSQADDARNDTEIAATASAAATNDNRAMGAPPEANSKRLALEGLGDLVVGEPAPNGSSFAERGAQIGDECRTISSPAYPGVYAITAGEGGPVRRITVGERSEVTLVEGIGVGATEQDVLAAFPGFRAAPHKYSAAPAKYLTQPGNDPRLRFEIGEAGRVSLIHVGLMPELGYVEGCA